MYDYYLLFQVSFQPGKFSLLVLALGFSLWFHLIGPRRELTFPPLCSSHSVLPTSPLSTTFILTTSSPLTLLLERWHFSWNDGSWVSCPHQNWMAFSLCLRGEEQWNLQMPSFILFSISSTYPIYNSASFLADWHSTLLTSQNKGNSRIRGKSRLPGFFCSHAFVRSFSARIWEVSAGSCASLSPPSAVLESPSI